MGASPAERQRRSRAHRKGDHSLCLPGHCPDVTAPVTVVTPEPVTPDVTDPVLDELGCRGRRLFADVLAEHKDMDARARVVLEEAARAADRCERLDRLLRANESEWARVEFSDTGTRFVLVIDKTMAEARQQQGTLARLMAELRQLLAPAAAKEAPAPTKATPQQGGGKVVNLAAAVAAKLAGASAG